MFIFSYKVSAQISASVLHYSGTGEPVPKIETKECQTILFRAYRTELTANWDGLVQFRPVRDGSSLPIRIDIGPKPLYTTLNYAKPDSLVHSIVGGPQGGIKEREVDGFQ